MTRYARNAMILHWVIAALLLFNFGLGERTDHMARGPGLFAAFQLHKSIGITVLLLSLWRLWIRLRQPRPALLGDNGWAHKLAEAVHWGFYVVMIGVPLTGWIIVSTAKIKIPTLVFGIIPWPHLPLGGRALHEFAEGGHALLAKLMILLVLLHVAGAIRHQFLKKEPLLERMMPVSRAGIGSLALALALLGGSLAYGRGGPIPGLEVRGASLTPAAPLPLPDGSNLPADASTAEGEAAEKDPAEAEKAAEETPEAEEKDKKPVVAAPIGAAPQWQVSSGGRLGFGVTVNGDAVTGSFSRWTGDIRFDPARLDQSAIKVNVDLASVSSGDDQRDSMLVGEDFFSTSAHPRATFTSNRIKSKGGNAYEARGNLSIRGISQPVRLDFTLDITGDRAVAKGTASLKRLDFGIGTGQFEGDDTISRTVPVNFSFNAKRQDSTK